MAWHHLGWQPVGFSEIEPFPSAVLAHHYPNVPNFGDMTQHEQWPLGPGSVDILVGGTPCQSFSVAGLRKGLSDPRGGLMLTYLEIARRLRPRWIVWENVPGVLSSGSGRDLGAFLGALGELGYGWAYRVLDAQWVRTQRHPRAVPQRRRRVFVVGCLAERCAGNWAAAAAVLLERESVHRNQAARRASRKGFAADAESCAGTVSSKWSKGTGGPAGDECYNLTTQHVGEVSGTIAARFGNSRNNHEECVAQPVGYRWQNDRDGLVEDGTAPACRASAGSSGFHEMNHPVIAQPVAFRKSRRAQSVNDHETWVAAEQANTLNSFDTGERDTHAVFATVDMQACKGNANIGDGSVSPTLCKPSGNDVHAVAIGTDCYNGAITGDVAATMGTPGSSVNASGPTVMQAQAHAFYSTGGTHGLNQHPGVSPAIKVGSGLGIPSPPAVAYAVAPTITAANDPSRSPQSSEVTQQVAAVHAASMTVRRLTPRECERLQGFPDDWTMIPWRKKAAEDCPDGPRYKALGNSMAVNVMAWIGERIDNYERTGNALRTEG